MSVRELSDQCYDVIIVGAGPAGSCAAYELANAGHGVAVFEEKSAPGLSVCCTGIISTECFDSIGVSTDVIMTASNSARFFSPSGRCLRLQTEEVQAYVVDRSSFDKAMASKAQAGGASYLFSSRVIDLIPGGDKIQAEVLVDGVSHVFDARAVILANGYRPGLSQRCGLGRTKSFLIGAQSEVALNGIDEVEVHFGREVAPGSFAWLVPTSSGRGYAGLLASSHAGRHLRRFLDAICLRNRIQDRDAEIRQKAIPIGVLARTYSERVLVIGDAAGHVKPTTGGGIYFGYIGAKMAAAVLDEALREDDLTAERLRRYQTLWKAKLGKELSRGYLARWLYSRLTDRQIERIFGIMDSTGEAEALLRSSEFSFDWHGRLVLAGLRRSAAYPWLRLRHFFIREVGI